jgi:hypothetical protein
MHIHIYVHSNIYIIYIGVGRVVKVDNAVASIVQKLLPDFQLLLNLRSKYTKQLASQSVKINQEAEADEKVYIFIYIYI